MDVFLTTVESIKQEPHVEMLCKSAKRALVVKNAGGKSEISEAISIQFFAERFGAKRFILENEVEYWAKFKMVDYLCLINRENVGVSVTRAMGHPTDEQFDEISAEKLLRRKLYGLVVSRNCTVKKHAFFKAILHIWCRTEQVASTLKSTFEGMDKTTYENVHLVVTVCDHPCIYSNANIFE